MTASTTSVRDRWRSRPFLTALVDLAALLVPGALALLAAGVAAVRLPHVNGGLRIAWWATVVAAAVLAGAAGDRVMRRLLPLGALLRLSLRFPDRAPSRVGIALRAGTLRDVEGQLRALAVVGTPADPTSAATHVLTLLAALTRHDRRTRGHSERVRALTDVIAEELHLTREDRDRLRWSSLLHDIGKLHVDVRVLTKPTPLDEAEWEEIRRHPEVGARISTPLRPWLGEWATAIEHHHERWDGGGYPHGTARNDIPLGARIVAVADAFEVMTAPRSYKRPIGVAAARAELVRCAGQQFDPRIVRAFLNVSLTRLRWIVGPAAVLATLPGGRRAAALGRLETHSPALRAGVAALLALSAVGATRAPVGPGESAAASEPPTITAAAAAPGSSRGITGLDGAAGTGPDGAESPAADGGAPPAGRLPAAAGAPAQEQTPAAAEGNAADGPSAPATDTGAAVEVPSDTGAGLPAEPHGAPAYVAGRVISLVARTAPTPHGLEVSQLAHDTPKRATR